MNTLHYRNKTAPVHIAKVLWESSIVVQDTVNAKAL
jgi:hypothetical protein